MATILTEREFRQLGKTPRSAPRKRPFRLKSPELAEHQLQIDCTKMLRRVLRHDVTWTAIDHANAKDRLTGAIRKARGVKAGIPDYLFWHRGRAYAIELKALGGQLSAAQNLFLYCLTVSDIDFTVCRSVAEVFQAVEEWGLTRTSVSSTRGTSIGRRATG